MVRVASSAVLDARALLTSIVSKAVFNRVKPPDMSKFSMNAASARSGKMMVMGKSLSIQTKASKIHQARVMYEGLTKVSNINNIWPACARWPSNTDRSCSEPVWHLDSKIRYWLLQKKPHHEKLEQKKMGPLFNLWRFEICIRCWDVTLWTKRSNLYCHAFVRFNAWPCIRRSFCIARQPTSCAARNIRQNHKRIHTMATTILKNIWKRFFISSYLLKYMPFYYKKISYDPFFVLEHL